MRLRRHQPDPSAAEHEAAVRAWLTPPVSDGSATVDVLLDAPVLAAEADLSHAEVAWLLRQLSVATASGIPLASALSMLAASAQDTAAARLCRDVEARVAAGVGLADAFELSGPTFTSPTVALVRAGEEVGDVAAGLDIAAQTLEELAADMDTLRHAAMFPLAASAAVGGLIAVLAFIATPLLAGSYGGSHLPSLTNALLAMARYAPAAVAPIAVALFLARTALRLGVVASAVRTRIDRAVLRSPGLARFVRQRGEARLAAVLGWLLSTGASPAEALRAAAATVGNSQLRLAAERAAAQVVSGAPLSVALSGEALIPPTLAEVVRTGEATGHLSALLARYAHLAGRQAKDSGDKLAAVVEPLACAAVGLVLAGWLLGVLLPLLTVAA